MTATIPEDLKSEPASTKLIWMVVQSAEQPLTQSEIGDRAGVSKWTVSMATKKLDRKGHLTRAPSDNPREKRWNCSTE